MSLDQAAPAVVAVAPKTVVVAQKEAPKVVALAQQTKPKAEKGMVISIEAVKKPEGANKAMQLKAMEEALKKATEEAHKQRVAITGETESLVQNTSTV